MVRFAVPEDPFRLSLFFRIFDRCSNCGPPASATGGGSPQFPRSLGIKRSFYEKETSPIRWMEDVSLAQKEGFEPSRAF